MNKIGYRFVLDQVKNAKLSRTGSIQYLEIDSSFRNVGNAPFYQGNYAALEWKVTLKDSNSTRTVTPVTLTSEENLKNWLPGSISFSEKLEIPQGLLATDFSKIKVCLRFYPDEETRMIIHLAITKPIDSEGCYQVYG